MVGASKKLLEAFREDHKILGEGFHQLSMRLRDRDFDGARKVAENLDQEAGSHIAFEEEAFYPKLSLLLGDDAVTRLYREHRDGLEVVQAFCDLPPDEIVSDAKRSVLLAKSEATEAHIAECGELFEALGRIPPSEQELLYEKLTAWRRRRPKWSAYAASQGAQIAGGA